MNGTRDVFTRPLILPTLVMVLAACSAGVAPSTPSPSPSHTPTPTQWPTIDEAAYDAAVAACRSPMPEGLDFTGYRLDRPAPVSGYDTVSLVPVSFYPDLYQRAAPMPASIAAMWFDGPPDEWYEPGFAPIARPIGGGAKVLVCASFRVTEVGYYQGGVGDLAIADEGMWAVDVATEKLIGNPWMIDAGDLPEFVNKYAGTDVGQSYSLYGGDRRAAARSAVLLLKGPLPTPTPRPSVDGSGG
jgi:hypothetical protein